MANDQFILGDSNSLCESKKCSRCKEDKPFAEFSRDKHSANGRKSACKICAQKYFKDWRGLNLSSARRSDRVGHYIRKYNLSAEKAEMLADNRHGECGICLSVTNLVVDHCHKTGIVRERICSACNSAIGYAKENLRTLENIIDYLKRHAHG
jgi:hypothetical protein